MGRQSREGEAVMFHVAALALLVAPGPAEKAPVADFTLVDAHRRPRSLADCKGKKAFVVVFLDTECPLAKLYLPTLVGLHREYAGKGVQFVAISSSRNDSFV